MCGTSILKSKIEPPNVVFSGRRREALPVGSPDSVRAGQPLEDEVILNPHECCSLTDYGAKLYQRAIHRATQLQQ
jgi:hypothetical protein